MTIEEQRTHNAIQNMNRKMKDQREIDWEQRRYEIARDVMCAIITSPSLGWDSLEYLAKSAVKTADALIEELKKK